MEITTVGMKIDRIQININFFMHTTENITVVSLSIVYIILVVHKRTVTTAKYLFIALRMRDL